MKKGFTLIELLIVVAIIAILAAIAVPNFLEAQTRSKVSRVKADMRTIATGLEAYAVDNNLKYPWDGQAQIPALPSTVYYGTDIVSAAANAAGMGGAHLNNMLTTPISYLTTISFKDPFVTDKAAGTIPTVRFVNFLGTYTQSTDATRKAVGQRYNNILGAWSLYSFGPDRLTSTSGGTIEVGITAPFWACHRYDPTNGTVSPGDIIRCQKYPADPQYQTVM